MALAMDLMMTVSTRMVAPSIVIDDGGDDPDKWRVHRYRAREPWVTGSRRRMIAKKSKQAGGMVAWRHDRHGRRHGGGTGSSNAVIFHVHGDQEEGFGWRMGCQKQWGRHFWEVGGDTQMGVEGACDSGRGLK